MVLTKKSFLRNLLRFVVKGEEEQKRIHKDFCRLLRHIPKVNNLLDVGCAEGSKTVQYAEILKVPLENIYGIEIADKYTEIAKDRLHLVNYGRLREKKKACYL